MSYKKIITAIVSVFLLLGLFQFNALAYEDITQNIPEKTAKIYRVLNTATSEHLYTASFEEVYSLTSDPYSGWKAEGVGWYAPCNQGDGVYRLYDPIAGTHLYTMDDNEVTVLTSHGWLMDFNGEPCFYSGGPTNVYRLYTDQANGLHHLTTDEDEYNSLPAQGWRQEGAALSCIKPGGVFPDENQVQEDILALQNDYPNDFPWSEEDVYYSVTGYSGSGCHGFALLVSDQAFGYLPIREHHDTSNIRVGDLVRVNNDGHTAVVVKIDGDDLYLTEGNWNDDVNWGRVINRNDPIDYILTRYPE